MAEEPYSKPTDDIAWGTDQSNELDPGAGQKATGWALNQLVPSNWWNWLWYRFTLLMLWNRGNAVRRFNRLDGSSGPLTTGVTVPGDRFTYVSDSRGNLRQAVVRKGTLASTGFTLAMATDGLNLWFAYVNGANSIIEARDLDDETSDGTALALSTSSWTDGVLAMDNDAMITALAADTSGAGHNLIVYSSRSGSVEFSGTVGAGASYSVVADSSSLEGLRAWSVAWNAGSGSALRMWSAENGTSGSLFAPAAEPLWDICVSPEAVFAIHGEPGVANTYGVTALGKDSDGNIAGATRVILYLGSDGADHKDPDVGARICTDGVRVYCVVGRRVGAAGTERPKIFALKADTTNHDPTATNAATQAAPLWSVDDVLAAEDMGATWYLKMRIAVDERFVYVTAGEVMVWLDKIDGAVVRRETVTGDAWSFAMAVSGERVYRGGLEADATPYSGAYSYSKATPDGLYVRGPLDPSETPGTPPDPSDRRYRRGYQLVGEGRP